MAIPLLTRRSVVSGTAVAAVGAVAGYLTTRASGAARGARGTTAANAYGPSARQAGRPLLALTRLPAGSAVVLGDDAILLSRSATGRVHAFSAVCTHQGCTVQASGGAVECPCHGSRFAADTGAVTRGPAARPLPPVPITVRNGEVYRS